MKSLRSRLLAGSVLWTAGLLPIAHIVSMIFLRHAAGRPIVLQLPVVALLVPVACMAAGVLAWRSGLAPFRELRAQLAAVRAAQAQRIEGRYPTEVQPLVDDLNGLLVHRDAIVHRALTTAGDLAHGLKTPLAVLAHEATRARERGEEELAATMDGEIERMRRQIEYQLARARAAGPAPGVRSDLRESCQALARTMRHLHADRGIEVAIEIALDANLAVMREDLEEMIGNLLDNGCKWARSSVFVRSEGDCHGFVAVLVDDDGPGLDPAMRSAVLQRGVRADESSAGSGLGLAIVAELATLYGGSIALESAPERGLRARLTLPIADETR